VVKDVFENILYKDPFYTKLEKEVTENKLDDKTSRDLTDFDNSP